jgi:hypothetical protein
MRPMTMEEVRLDTAKAARFSASALSTGAFDALPPTQSTIYLPKAPEARSSPRKPRPPPPGFSFRKAALCRRQAPP